MFNTYLKLKYRKRIIEIRASRLLILLYTMHITVLWTKEQIILLLILVNKEIVTRIKTKSISNSFGFKES